MDPTNLQNLIPTTVDDAIELFKDEFASSFALGEVANWADQFGFNITQDTAMHSRVRLPIGISAPEYREFLGDRQARNLTVREVEVVTKKLTDGVGMDIDRLKVAGGWLGWMNQPSMMAQEALRNSNELIAAGLESNAGAGPLLEIYRDPDVEASVSPIRLFAANHRENPVDANSDTFSNILAATTVRESIIEALTHFRSLNGPNGKTLNARGVAVGVPTARHEEFMEYIERDLNETSTGSTPDNYYNRVLEVVPMVELTDPNRVYFFGEKMGMYPWAVWRGTPMVTTFDETSDKVKNSGRFEVHYDFRSGFAFAHPQTIAVATLS